MKLEPTRKPAHLKCGIFGSTGSGKTYTAALLLSQFIRHKLKGAQLAMFDTEGGAGFVAPMVQEITGKPLLSIASQGFPDLLDFAAECKAKGYVALCDSITHPWRSLVADYLRAKRSRVKSAGGNPETVRLSLKDWGPIKDAWARFADAYRYDPVHWCICGREGDVWDEREDEEGKTELHKSGVKMKTETETGYEPSILIRMELVQGARTVHRATIVKDRFALLTGQSADEPAYEFFAPHINNLDLGGDGVQPHESAPAFEAGHGKNWETIKAERQGMLDKIKDDLLLKFPGQAAKEKQARVEALRGAFGDVSWSELESNHHKWPLVSLEEGRVKLLGILKVGEA